MSSEFRQPSVRRLLLLSTCCSGDLKLHHALHDRRLSDDATSLSIRHLRFQRPDKLHRSFASIFHLRRRRAGHAKIKFIDGPRAFFAIRRRWHRDCVRRLIGGARVIAAKARERGSERERETVYRDRLITQAIAAGCTRNREPINTRDLLTRHVGTR